MPFIRNQSRSNNDNVLTTIDTASTTLTNIDESEFISSDPNVYDESVDTFNIYLVNEEIVYTQPTTMIVDDTGVVNEISATTTIISNAVERSKHLNQSTTTIVYDEDDEMFVKEEDFHVSDDVEFSSEALRELGYNSFELNSSNLYQCFGCQFIMETEAQLSLHQFSCCKYIFNFNFTSIRYKVYGNIGFFFFNFIL